MPMYESVLSDECMKEFIFYILVDLKLFLFESFISVLHIAGFLELLLLRKPFAFDFFLIGMKTISHQFYNALKV